MIALLRNQHRVPHGWWFTIRTLRGAGASGVGHLCATVLGIALVTTAWCYAILGITIFDQRASIVDARQPVFTYPSDTPPAATKRLTYNAVDDSIDGRPWYRVEVSTGSPIHMLAPGVAEWPAQGHSIVSPALAKLLTDNKSDQVRELLGTVEPRTIAPDGLAFPDELVSYSVVSADDTEHNPADMSASGPPRYVKSFGQHASKQSAETATLLTAEMMVLLGLPAALFLSVVWRGALNTRVQRAQALHHMGVPPAAMGSLFGREVAVLSAIGTTLGWSLYAVTQAKLGMSGLTGLTWFKHQGTPHPVTVILLGIVVTITAWVVAARTMVASTRTRTRASKSPGRRQNRAWTTYLGVALALMSTGFACSVLARWGTASKSTTLVELPGRLFAPSLLALLIGVIGVMLLSGRLVTLISSWLKTAYHGPSWQLATSRLNKLKGLSAMLIPAIAASILVTGASETFVTSIKHSTTDQGSYTQLPIDILQVNPDAIAELATTPLANTVGSLTLQVHEGFITVVVGSCTALHQAGELADTSGCTDDAPALSNAAAHSLGSGRVIQVEADKSLDVASAPIVSGLRDGSVKVPWSMSGALLTSPAFQLRMVVPTEPPHDEEQQAVVRQRLPGSAIGSAVKDPQRYEQFLQQQAILRSGTTAGVLLVGSSLLLAFAQTLRRQRRSTSALAALGTPASTLRLANAWTAVIPIVVVGLPTATLVVLHGWVHLGFYGVQTMFAPSVVTAAFVPIAVLMVLGWVSAWISAPTRFDPEAMRTG